MLKRSLLLALGAAGLVMFCAPREAKACGGTFCDAGPQAMPVDQTGEVVLFVMGEETTEAHIKIQYDPDAEAEEFAWLVPITELPEFAVGSDLLFDNVLAGTVPSYGFTTQFDTCGDGDDDDDDDAAGDDDDDDDDDGGPNIVLAETVGAFDIVVLQGGTADEVVDWLDTNGYQQDPDAVPIIEEYLAENYLFAAFKLTNGADTDEIHPIALTFPNNEACVPLRLTRIAAVEDMDIRTFFLADDRVVPQTYKHVLVNPLKLDWPSLGSNYKELISLAVDADEANGRAFVTEYAGPSNVVSDVRALRHGMELRAVLRAAGRGSGGRAGGPGPDDLLHRRRGQRHLRRHRRHRRRIRVRVQPSATAGAPLPVSPRPGRAR